MSLGTGDGVETFSDPLEGRAGPKADFLEDGGPPIHDAGTLVIVDDTERIPSVLVGRRAAGHVFMPNRYVFPGGRVDPSDVELAGQLPLSQACCDRLTARTAQGFGPRQAAATALAAIRETFEEAGVLVGEPAPFACTHPGWIEFAERGLRPFPQRLVPFARAVTPPGPPRRFDTRFFCIARSAVIDPPSFDVLPSDELEDVSFVGLDDLADRSLAPITLRILSELRSRIAKGNWLDSTLPMPLYRFENGAFTRELV